MKLQEKQEGLTGSLLIFKIMRNFGMHSNEIMKKLKKF